MKPAPVHRHTAAAAVDERRLWQRHAEMAKIGGTAKGGVNRQALTEEDGRARARLAVWAKARGFAVSSDAIGNLFVRRPGRDPQATPVVTGSHLDSQPTGGRFDGTYGVLAGFEVLEALEDTGIETRRPVEVVAWTNEEGSRFQPGCMGSMVFSGRLRLEDALAVADRTGATVRDALDALGLAGLELRAPQAAAYVEAHIEQGPLLEAEGRTIGAVTGIQGCRWFAIELRGEEAHAGTTPHTVRKDAFKAALAICAALEQLMADPEDRVRFTVGRFEVAPGSPNTVPGHVFFTVDFRHPDPAVLTRLGDRVALVAREHARGCAVSVTETLTSPPVAFDERIVNRVAATAEALGLPHRRMVSGANHDARFLAELCPTGMIFVPCERGVSHNEAENARPGDLAAGARVLAEVLLELAH
jgi:N-carbamoyl-L-amino-acid hydrolase